MNAVILDGKKIAGDLNEEIKKEITLLSQRHSPKLAAIQIGSDPASEAYVRSQQRRAQDVGIDYRLEEFNYDVIEDELAEVIDGLNKDKEVTGIIIQRPVPKGIDIQRLIYLINPQKDTEGVHPENMGRLFSSSYIVAPPTSLAVMKLLEETGAELYGKDAVIIGHSDIAGKPLSILLLNEFATTSVCHIATSERGRIPEYIKRAEVLISAAGVPGLVKGSWIKEGAIVVDVGINKVGENIVGDVEFETAKTKASYITPVPGGVGPVTTAMLMKNCLQLFKIQSAKQ